MNDAARSVRKAKALTRSLCKAVEANMWAEQRCNTVESVLLRRRSLCTRGSDLDWGLRLNSDRQRERGRQRETERARVKATREAEAGVSVAC